MARELGEIVRNANAESRAFVFDVAALRKTAVVATALDQRPVERVERIGEQHPRIALSGATQVFDVDLESIARSVEREGEADQRIRFRAHRHLLALRQRIAFGEQLRDRIRVGRRSVVLLLVAHVLSLIPARAEAQAQDLGPYVRSSWGVLLEGRGNRALTLSGRAFSVEAGVAIPGEASFAFELGIRGRSVTPSESLERSTAVRTLGLTGGARAGIGFFPIELGLVPILTGGLEISMTHDAGGRAGIPSTDRIGLGPHFGIGLEHTLFPDAVLSVLLMGRGEIVPATLELGVTIELRVGS